MNPSFATVAYRPDQPALTRTPLDPARLTRAKAAYTTRFVASRLAADPTGYHLLTGADVIPAPGDVVLARVEALGQHVRLEDPDGRKGLMFLGDEILVAYGHRYAPDQFEADVPADLRPLELVAAGGVAGRVLTASAAMKPATRIVPCGLLADAEGLVTLRRAAAIPRTDVAPAVGAHRPPTIAVLGTSMNSGKTTTVAAIVRGLTAAGLRVAAGKVTGTGAGGDPGLFRDSGACRVLDFTDFGHASTFQLDHHDVQDLLIAMVRELAADAPDAIVLEIADGVLQRETGRLVADPLLRGMVDRFVFAAGEALGAAAGVGLLARQGVDVSLVSGALTASPLATREAAGLLDLPVLDVGRLAEPSVAELLLTSLDGGRGWPDVAALRAG